jgi:hypothetical protein
MQVSKSQTIPTLDAVRKSKRHRRGRSSVRRPLLERLEDRPLLSGGPTVTTLAATAITVGTATLNASVNPNGSSTDTSFQYSLDPTLPANIVTTLAGSPGQSGRAEGLASPLGAGRCHDAQGRRNRTPVNSGEAACRHSRPRVARPRRSRTRCSPSRLTGWFAVRNVMDTVVFIRPQRRRWIERAPETLRSPRLTATAAVPAPARSCPSRPGKPKKLRQAVPSSPVGLRSPIRHHAVPGRYRWRFGGFCWSSDSSVVPVSGPGFRSGQTNRLPVSVP